MNRIEIEECNDIEILRRLCIRQHSAILRIGETLVDNSKSHLTDERTLVEIREILRFSDNPKMGY
jgi:hypothetical protein